MEHNMLEDHQIADEDTEDFASGRFVQKSLREQVIEFKTMASHPMRDVPGVPPEARVRLAMALITEEYFEMMVSVFPYMADSFKTKEAHLMTTIERAPIDVDMEELMDGAADLDYVVEGMRLEFGVDGEPIANEVHITNMAKTGGPVDPVTGKKGKPAGWQPPDIRSCLLRQGWKPSSVGEPKVRS